MPKFTQEHLALAEAVQAALEEKHPGKFEALPHKDGLYIKRVARTGKRTGNIYSVNTVDTPANGA